MTADIKVQKSADIGLRQARIIANLSRDERFALIAEGLPIILRSAQDLVAASTALAEHPRAAEVIERAGEEEAAKILILLDYVRCPPGRSNRAAAVLQAFYNHGARLIYAEACGWKPTNVAMLRQYVDQERVSHYIEGDVGQWIVPNWQHFTREATLYADIVRSDTGELSWNDPLDWGKVRPDVGLRPPVLQVAEALEHLGAFQPAGLRLVADIWGAVPFTDLEGADTSCELIRATIEGLAAEGLTSGTATNDDARTLCWGWQMLMYDFDFKLIEIPLTDLQEDQERYLYRELGY
jgi:hypothetical protein